MPLEWVSLCALASKYPLMQGLAVKLGMAALFHNLCSLPCTRVFPANSVAAVNSP